MLLGVRYAGQDGTAFHLLYFAVNRRLDKWPSVWPEFCAFQVCFV